ncbi:hypothetical protein Arub01_50000 [Actinomadura rubrobrunea]|uniref:Uncharacterized protein n=1 Tax=Actinomadura rubrobrunea TaxID=115335 RepID=A0A9W6Q1E0_9ACTN|nr:hypothetical protein [Actinomadura rubrobrunea]GLW66756.1 hypothetical protein Arub01_50000 [Actinomadura rubrobrunea]
MNDVHGGGPSPPGDSHVFRLHVMLSTLPTPGGTVPLALLDDPDRTPVPDAHGGEPTSALLAACLRGGLGLATDAPDLHVPLAPGWAATLDRDGAFTVRSPLDRPDRPFCRVEGVGAPPGWAERAAALGYVLVFAGRVGVADAPGDLQDRLHGAAAEGMLAAGIVPFRPAS